MMTIINRAERSEYDYKVTRANVYCMVILMVEKYWQKLFLVNAFPKLTMKKRVSKLTDVYLNIWLKNHLIRNRSSFLRSAYQYSNNYDEIFSFLIQV